MQHRRNKDMQKASLSTVDNLINMLRQEEENFMVDCTLDTNGQSGTITVEYTPSSIYWDDFYRLGKTHYMEGGLSS